MIKVHCMYVWKNHNETTHFVQLIHTNENNLKKIMVKRETKWMPTYKWMDIEAMAINTIKIKWNMECVHSCI
jgi:hypothetical protein